MTGAEKAKETRDRIAGEVVSDHGAEQIFTPATVEHHTQVAKVKHYSTIKGLEEVSTDIIPLPYYKLVQPGSTGIKLADDGGDHGNDANPGQFYMADSGTALSEIKVGIVRVKRLIKEYQGKKSVSLGILGVNLETMTPFLMNVSSTNFSNFGRLMNNLNQKKIDAIWKFPIKLVSGDDYKVETKKFIDGREQMVKYWTMDFVLEEEAFNEEDLKTMQTVLAEYAGTLDRDQTDEEGMPF